MLKKFRFDSFASEFASSSEEEKVLEHTADNDSGIDSEETQVSPPICRLVQPKSEIGEEMEEPLSLVLRKPNSDGVSRHGTPTVKRHWKKFLKDQASTKMESPSKRFKSEPYQEEAENLCISDIHRQNTESTVAQALLSLGRSDYRLSMTPGRTSLPLQPVPIQSLLQPQHLNKNLSAGSRVLTSHSENISQIRLPQYPTPLPYATTNLLFQQANPKQASFHAPLKEIQSHHVLPTLSAFSPPLSYHCSDENSRMPGAIFSPENQDCLADPVNLGSRSSQSRKPFYCPECKKGFSTHSGFVKHEELHRANQIQKNFSCRFCNKGYTSLSALKMHTRTHTLPCKCHICGKSFSRPWLLQGHVRTHTGEKPFSCSYCLRSFADKSNLRAHLQTHLQTKKYSCACCFKTFSRMSLLNKHSESGCPAGLKVRTNENVQSISAGLLRT